MSKNLLLILVALIVTAIFSLPAAITKDANSSKVQSEFTSAPLHIFINPSSVQSVASAPQGLMREHPYMAHFRKAGVDLYFVSANHEHKAGCETFEVIRKSFQRFPIKRVIIEGRRYSDGNISHETIARSINESRNGFYNWGEGEYAMTLAAPLEVPTIGGEPSAKAQAIAALNKGFKVDDVLGMSFVKMIPAYRAQGRIEKDGIAKLFTETMKWQGGELEITEAKVRTFDLAAFMKWYRDNTGSDFDAKTIDYNLMAPNPHGTFLQRLAEVDDVVRNQFLAGVINAELGKYKQVLVVYGSGHYAAQRQAIATVMGRPLYEGDLNNID